MKLSEFDYDLPPELIAQNPLKERDQARLLVIDRKQSLIIHDIFTNVGEYLSPQSMLVLNDSKVIPARLLGFKERNNGKVEIFLLKQLADKYSYKTLLRPLRRLQNGDKIYFDNRRGLIAEIIDWKERIVAFNKKDISKDLESLGHIPLPPYIKRPDKAQDKKYYQTVYAKNKGSVASPTAGLHFTNSLLAKLKKNGHRVEKVTLHINYATFKEVEEDNIVRHQMHSEGYCIKDTVYGNILKAKKDNKKIVAVGTTSARVLETVFSDNKLAGETNIFIYPGYKFKAVDSLITNFHLPKSTLLMLVYAFAGEELAKRAYQEAIKNKYRFYSYGDCMLII